MLFRVKSGRRVLVSNRNGGSDSVQWGVSLFNDGVLYGLNGSIQLTEDDPRNFPAINHAYNFAILAMTVKKPEKGTAEENIVRVVRYANGGLEELLNIQGTISAW